MRTVCQLLSALHRKVFPILWPSRTTCIFSSLSATRPDLQTITAHEATRLEVPNKMERHVKFGGQVPPTVIGQSQTAMAAWHDFLGQSSRIYRALHRGPGRRIWSFPAGAAGLPIAPPSATLLGNSRVEVDLGRPSSPTFACDYHHIDQRPGRRRNGQVTCCVWDLIKLLYLHPPHCPSWSPRHSSLASFNKRSTAQQQLAAVID